MLLDRERSVAGEKKENGGLGMTLQLNEVGALLLVARPCRLPAYLVGFYPATAGAARCSFKRSFWWQGEGIKLLVFSLPRYCFMFSP